MTAIRRCASSPDVLMTPRVQGPEVLVVGYVEAYRGVLERTLTKRGYTPLTAANEAEGLRLFKLHRKICLVLIGVGWGLCTQGVETVREMRLYERQQERFRTSIVANTYFPALDTNDSIAAGADDCVRFTGSLVDMDNSLKKYAVYH